MLIENNRDGRIGGVEGEFDWILYIEAILRAWANALKQFSRVAGSIRYGTRGPIPFLFTIYHSCRLHNDVAWKEDSTLES